MWVGQGLCSIVLFPAVFDVNGGTRLFAIDTYPDTLHVEGNAIGRNALMVSGFENIVIPTLINEAATQSVDVGLKRVGCKKFVGESGE